MVSPYHIAGLGSTLPNNNGTSNSKKVNYYLFPKLWINFIFENISIGPYKMYKISEMKPKSYMVNEQFSINGFKIWAQYQVLFDLQQYILQNKYLINRITIE